LGRATYLSGPTTTQFAMKLLIPIILSLFAMSQSYAQVEPEGYRKAHQEIIFQRSMSQGSLDQLKKDLAESDVKLTYEDVTFGPTGGLMAITFKVKDSSGREYTASADELPTVGFFGFEFGYVDGKSFIINVGTLEGKKP